MSTIIKHEVHTHLSLHREGGEANYSPAQLPGWGRGECPPQMAGPRSGQSRAGLHGLRVHLRPQGVKEEAVGRKRVAEG